MTNHPSRGWQRRAAQVADLRMAEVADSISGGDPGVQALLSEPLLTALRRIYLTGYADGRRSVFVDEKRKPE